MENLPYPLPPQDAGKAGENPVRLPHRHGNGKDPAFVPQDGLKEPGRRHTDAKLGGSLLAKNPPSGLPGRLPNGREVQRRPAGIGLPQPGQGHPAHSHLAPAGNLAFPVLPQHHPLDGLLGHPGAAGKLPHLPGGIQGGAAANHLSLGQLQRLGQVPGYNIHRVGDNQQDAGKAAALQVRDNLIHHPHRFLQLLQPVLLADGAAGADHHPVRGGKVAVVPRPRPNLAPCQGNHVLEVIRLGLGLPRLDVNINQLVAAIRCNKGRPYMAPHVSRPDDSNSAHGAIPSLSQSYFQGNPPNLFRFIIADRRPVCNGFPADLTEVLPSLYNWYKILVGRGNFCAAQMQGHGLPPIPAFFFFLRKKKKKQKEERQRYPPLLCQTP